MSGRFPEPGKLFEEKYRVERLLGSGGFARVYLAEQTDLGRKVAIKVLSPKVSQAVGGEQTDPQIESVALRFEREARVVSQLKSPQTITIYDYGRTDGGLLYMVMEYVDGTELDEIPVPIEPRRVVNILKQVLQSLREAHANGLLHRDLKPANIMVYEHLGQKDQVKLLDFGIAKAVGQAASDADKDLTAADSLIGTPRYMSPEQIRGEDIGPASDIYSVGLVAYELLMGEKAITNSDSIEILGKHLSSESFEIPRHHAIHPKLRRLINKMLSKRLDERYQSTEEVLADLAEIEQVAGDLRIGGPPAFDDDSLQEASADDDDIEELDPAEVQWESSADDGGSRGLVWAAVALVVLIGGGVAIWQVVGTPHKQDISEAHPEVAQKPAPSKAPQVKAAADDDKPDKPPAVITLIRTDPKGASVWLGERLVGMAPVQFGSDEYQFPLTVRVKLGDRSAEQTLEKPGGEHVLKLPPKDQLAEQAPTADKPAEHHAAHHAQRHHEQTASDTKAKPKRDKKPSKTANADAKPANPPSTPTATPADTTKPDKTSKVKTRKYLPLE